MSPRIAITLLTLATAACPAFGQAPTVLEKQELYPRESAVKLRLLSKPFAKIYRDRSCKDDTVVASPPAFSVFHVLRPPSPGSSPVYEIADSSARSLGYIKETDVTPWKQALCLKFEHSGNREPVLMFGKKEDLKSIVASDEGLRTSKARTFYETIQSLGKGKTPPAGFPVVSVEPRRMGESSASSYLMPIVDSELTEMGEDDVRLLQVAIAAGRETPRGATTLADADYVQSANQDASGADAANAPIEIVYCFDLSGSMQPYVDICADLARVVSQQMGKQPGFQKRVKFGLWGYRDHGEEGREFVVKNFTPKLEDIDTFVLTLAQAKASASKAGDYEEDVLGGVYQSVAQSWSDTDAIRVLVLCGDAPGHDLPNDQKNGSRTGTTQLREAADAKKVSIFAIHIKDQPYAKFHDSAETQFRTLSRNPGTGDNGSYVTVSVDSSKPFNQASLDSFNSAAKSLYDALGSWIGSPDQASEALAKRPSDDSESTPSVVANDMFRAAMVDWIGRNSTDAQTPNDVTAWISERDLLNGEPAVTANLLVSRVQLNQLTETLQLVLDAGLEGKQTGREFFSSLQSVAATAVRDPSKLKNAKSLKEAGMIPEFIAGLPYKSRILSLTNDLWSSWPPTQQEKFLEEVQKSISHYKDIHNTPSRWVDLDGRSSDDDKVTEIPLDLLP